MPSALGLDEALPPGPSLISPHGAYLVTLQRGDHLVLYTTANHSIDARRSAHE